MLTLENSRGLAAILMNEYFESATGEQFVQWAQDALEEGHDSSSLLKLAIEEPPHFTPDLRSLFRQATEEIGIEDVTFDQARAFYAQLVARELVSSSAPPREIAARFSRLFPSIMASATFDVWWQLDEAFDCDYCLLGVQRHGKTLEEAILKELENLLRFEWRAA